MKRSKIYSRILFIAIILLSGINQSTAQTHSIILGRPTDVSVTASILFDYNADFYLEYGTSSGNYTSTTTVFSNTANFPDEIDLSGLSPDTRYYYRLNYRNTGSGAYTATPEYIFQTQRAPGSSFTFTIEADEHLYDKKGVDNMYRVTLENQAADHPDFMLTLGDIFGDDHTPDSTTLADMDALHLAYRPFLGEICHSVPFYVCLGNHEGESDFYLDSTPPNNIAVYGTLTRKKYYPNPSPNSFYSGDTIPEAFGMDLPENYYAWTWGDAQFIVLDVYRTECHDTLVAKPQGWNWTLGENQYNWLVNTLQQSTARYKFVFAHHLRGQGRGGILEAPLYEWGGYQSLGGNYTFQTHRPGWPLSIHELFVNYGVNVFFQGHDHLFAHEVLDSVVYQEVPMAADSTYEIGMLANADAYTADTIDGTGHIRVNVSHDCVQVDFVRAYLPADTLSGVHHNGEIAFSYTIGNCSSGISDLNGVEEIKAYPNPSSQWVNLKCPEGNNVQDVYIYNALGEEVMKLKSGVVNVSALPSGLYLAKVDTGKKTFHSKFFVNH